MISRGIEDKTFLHWWKTSVIYKMQKEQMFAITKAKNENEWCAKVLGKQSTQFSTNTKNKNILRTQ